MSAVRRREERSRVGMTVSLAGLALAGLVAMSAPATAQMPDARAMSGIPMPAGDVPNGSIVVRVVRQTLDNNVAGQDVELHVGSQVLRATTDATGRATFSGLTAGTHAHAVAVVDGERLESEHLDLGPTGGIRVLLVAGVGAGGAASRSETGERASGPPVAGDVVFGGQSRIQIEFDDDSLEVFYLLEVTNRQASPVAPAQELSFELPPDAEGAAVLEGSSPQVALRGRTVSVTGPFSPGATHVRVAYTLPGGAAARVIRQSLPAPWEQVQVFLTQVGRVELASPQLASVRTMSGQGGTFVMGTAPSLAAGSQLELTLTGLPYRSRAGRWLALAAAALVLAIGAWVAFGGRRTSALDARRAQLEARRQKLMDDLVRLETQRAQGKGDAGRYAARRQELVAQLERVYGELDQHGAGGGVE